ncbi:Protein SOSEKI 5 [Linum perenne]
MCSKDRSFWNLRRQIESAKDSFRSLKVSAEIHGHKPSSSTSSDELVNRPVVQRRRNQLWRSIDLSKYKVYKADPFSQSSRRLAADATAQTDHKWRRRREAKLEEEEDEEGETVEELMRPERESRKEIKIGIGISPPPSDSSPETF